MDVVNIIKGEPLTDRKIVSLNVTERCNLKCIYCYQKDGRNQKSPYMTFEVATGAIEEQLAQEDDFKDVTIELIGGEVFLDWPLVKEIIEWTEERSSDWKKAFRFFIDTNGTLLTDEIKEWLKARKHYVTLGLSLDGTPEVHNYNRSNSYAKISPHFEFVANTWPLQAVKMTISPQSVPKLVDSIIHIMRLGMQVAANVPLENIWGTSEEKEITVNEFGQQIVKLVDIFTRCPDLPLPSLINLPIITIISESDRDRRWCGSGRNMIAYEADGKKLPCNRYAAMSFDQSLFNKPFKEEEPTPCENCLLKPACQTCEVHNWEVNGNPNCRTTFHCEFIMWQAWGTAKVHIERMKARIEAIETQKELSQASFSDELQMINYDLTASKMVLEYLASIEHESMRL